jgi:hypothetical protein
MATVKKIKKAQYGYSIGTRTTRDSKTGTYDKLDRFKNVSGGDRYYRSTGKDFYNLGKQNSRKSMMNSADSTRYSTLTPEEKKDIASQENPKSKNGSKVMLKRKDGSKSPRGLWDNIRAAKGSGKKPTAAMLKQEKKIKSKTKK